MMKRINRQSITSLLLALFCIGCSRPIGLDELAYPKKVAIWGEYEQTIEVNSVLDEPIGVQVLNNFDSPVVGVKVLFTVMEGDAVVNDSIVVTGPEGISETLLKFGVKSGRVIVNAYVYGLDGSPVIFSFYLSSSVPANIAIISGNDQEDYPGTFLSTEPLAVLVTDKFNNPINNANVRFMVEAGDGSIETEFDVSNSDGIASTRFTLANNQTTNKVKASIDNDSSVVFLLHSVLPNSINEPLNNENSIVVTWSKNDNANFKSYNLYRSIETLNFSNKKLIKTFSSDDSLSYTDYDVQQGTDYSYTMEIVTDRENMVSTKLVLTTFGEFIDLEITDMTMTDAGDVTYISQSTSNQILILNNSTKSKFDSISLDFSPEKVVLSNDQKKLFVIYSPASFAIIDLTQKTIISTHTLSTLLGSTRISDIHQTSNGNIYASSIVGYVAMLLNEFDNNPTRVFNDFFTRQSSKFIGSFGNYLYLGTYSYNPNSLYKFDITNPADAWILEDKHGSIGDISNGTLSPDGNLLYTARSSILNTSDFSNYGQFNFGLYVDLSLDGLRYYQAGVDEISIMDNSINIVDSQSLTFINSTPVSVVLDKKILIYPDESTALVLSPIKGSNQTRLFFIKLNK